MRLIGGMFCVSCTVTQGLAWTLWITWARVGACACWDARLSVGRVDYLPDTDVVILFTVYEISPMIKGLAGVMVITAVHVD